METVPPEKQPPRTPEFVRTSKRAAGAEPSSPGASLTELRKLSRESSLRVPVVFIAISIAVVLVYYGAPVFLPFLLAVFLFLLLDPMVMALEKRRIPRAFGATLAVTLSVMVLSGTGFAFYGALKKMADKIPTYSEKITSVSRTLHGAASRFAETTEVFLDGKGPRPNPVSSDDGQSDVTSTSAPPSSPVRSMAPYLVRGVTSALSLISWLFFIPLITLFLLLEKRELAERLKRIISNPARFERIAFEMREMSHGFFLGNFVILVFMTAAFAGTFYLMKLETAFQLALFAGFLNLVPVFGAFLGAILPVAQAFLQFDGVGPIWVVLTASIVIHFFGNNIVMPKFLGNRVNVNASSAMIGFLFWGAMWGAPGLFLAIPLMASIRILLESSERWSDISDLISQTPTSGLARISLKQVFRRGVEGRA